MATGRTTEARTVTITSSTGSTAISAPPGTLDPADQGRAITGTGIPSSTTLTTVTSDTAGTLSAAATATGARTVTIGASTYTDQAATAQALGYTGWSPETAAEQAAYTATATTTPPDRITSPTVGRQQRGRG